jgi:hypothetical protein
MRQRLRLRLKVSAETAHGRFVDTHDLEVDLAGQIVDHRPDGLGARRIGNDRDPDAGLGQTGGELPHTVQTVGFGGWRVGVTDEEASDDSHVGPLDLCERDGCAL